MSKSNTKITLTEDFNEQCKTFITAVAVPLGNERKDVNPEIEAILNNYQRSNVLLERVERVAYNFTRFLAPILHEGWRGEVDAVPPPLLLVMLVLSNAFAYFRRWGFTKRNDNLLRVQAAMWKLFDDRLTTDLLTRIIQGANGKRTAGLEIPSTLFHIIKVFSAIIDPNGEDHTHCPLHKSNLVDSQRRNTHSDGQASMDVLLNALQPLGYGRITASQWPVVLQRIVPRPSRGLASLLDAARFVSPEYFATEVEKTDATGSLDKLVDVGSVAAPMPSSRPISRPNAPRPW